MILYHLDRGNTFPKNPNKQLLQITDIINIDETKDFFFSSYPEGISYQGRRYLSLFDVNYTDDNALRDTCLNYKAYTLEYIFETVRLMHFPDCPSRFTSIFACRTSEDVKCWYDTLKDNPEYKKYSPTVKIIETTNATFIGDSSWRDMCIPPAQELHFSPFAYQEFAQKYWSGKTSRKPKLEVLCKLPVTVIDCISISEFLKGC